MGGHEPSLLKGLKEEMLIPLPEVCDTIYEYINEEEGKWKGYTRPGKGCRIRRGGVDSYLDSKIELEMGRYSSWDVGRSLENDERLWGGAAGPFEFVPNKRFDDLVEEQ